MHSQGRAPHGTAEKSPPGSEDPHDNSLSMTSRYTTTVSPDNLYQVSHITLTQYPCSYPQGPPSTSGYSKIFAFSLLALTHCLNWRTSHCISSSPRPIRKIEQRIATLKRLTRQPPAVMVSQFMDGKWRIESLQEEQYQVEARRRYDYVSLMPKLALFCLAADCVYLSYRILLVKRASHVDTAIYIALFIEVAFAGHYEPVLLRFGLTVDSNLGTSASAVPICLGQS